MGLGGLARLSGRTVPRSATRREGTLMPCAKGDLRGVCPESAYGRNGNVALRPIAGVRWFQSLSTPYRFFSLVMLIVGTSRQSVTVTGFFCPGFKSNISSVPV